MAADDPYYNVDGFKRRVGIDSAGEDAEILEALKAASRQIDGFCGRTFGQSAIAETRHFSVPRFRDQESAVLLLEDFVSVAAVNTDDGSRTWDTLVDPDDYLTYPSTPGLGEPYTGLSLLIGSWPFGRERVAVSAIWGWPAVPDVVAETCFLIANRLKSLWKAPFGKTGAGELGAGLNMTNALAPLIKEQLAPYRVLTV